MRFNEKEIVSIASRPGDKEGRLFYKSPGFREVYKERWFKLKGNILFYFRLNEYGAVYENEPVGVIVVEQCGIKEELYTELPNAFSITFVNDFEKRHYFGCQTPKQMEEWMNILKVCSFEYQRTLLKNLQSVLLTRTGIDPLSAFSTSVETMKIEDDSDEYFSQVHLFSKANPGVSYGLLPYTHFAHHPLVRGVSPIRAHGKNSEWCGLPLNSWPCLPYPMSKIH